MQYKFGSKLPLLIQLVGGNVHQVREFSSSIQVLLRSLLGLFTCFQTFTDFLLAVIIHFLCYFSTPTN